MRRSLRAMSLAGIVTAVVYGAFSAILSVVFYRSTLARLWIGIASVPFGPVDPDSRDAGLAIGLGILVHVVSALAWSAVFVFAAMRLSWVKAQLASTRGALAVAAVYGPFVWLVMSMVAIPAFKGLPPTLGFRWWVLFFAHTPFVGLPIALTVQRSLDLLRPTTQQP